jgi:N-acetyl-gamma-glutamyl-phosphate reductase
VIDLSGAWRLAEATNRAVYAFEDDGTDLAAGIQAQAVYGMPELHRAQIAGARLVANPGCYATSIILALKPLVAAGLIDLDHGIVADSKSGVSGAGKGAHGQDALHVRGRQSLRVCRLLAHRHTGELLEQIASTKARLSSRPICCPFRAEFLSTIYVRFASRRPRRASHSFTATFLPAVPWCASTTRRCRRFNTSVRTNYADIGFQLAARWPPRSDRQLSR